jgi:hypothetical protein
VIPADEGTDLKDMYVYGWPVVALLSNIQTVHFIFHIGTRQWQAEHIWQATNAMEGACAISNKVHFPTSETYSGSQYRPRHARLC